MMKSSLFLLASLAFFGFTSTAFAGDGVQKHRTVKPSKGGNKAHAKKVKHNKEKSDAYLYITMPSDDTEDPCAVTTFVNGDEVITAPNAIIVNGNTVYRFEVRSTEFSPIDCRCSNFDPTNPQSVAELASTCPNGKETKRDKQTFDQLILRNLNTGKVVWESPSYGNWAEAYPPSKRGYTLQYGRVAGLAGPYLNLEYAGSIDNCGDQLDFKYGSNILDLSQDGKVVSIKDTPFASLVKGSDVKDLDKFVEAKAKGKLNSEPELTGFYTSLDIAETGDSFYALGLRFEAYHQDIEVFDNWDRPVTTYDVSRVNCEKNKKGVSCWGSSGEKKITDKELAEDLSFTLDSEDYINTIEYGRKVISVQKIPNNPALIKLLKEHTENAKAFCTSTPKG